ncbi:Scr1 family TA system antitoxin-like transcriptional regulator [Streptomyces sp. NPDC050504]|uniref:helix-turn-helix domain-containing protein n=1 Tax=Streptomyces sp. NPDC050504 TaxID=3365618 RepID=UPI00379C8FEA
MKPKNRKPNASAMKLLGQQVQALRKAAGKTQQTLAEGATVDVETIASIEQGRRTLTKTLADRLDGILDSKGVLAVGVANLPEVDQFPQWAEEYMEHEKEAISLSWYDNQVVPGLLQTPEYARALFRSRVPAHDEEKIESLTTARLERQKILYRKDPPTISFVIWEPVLHMPLGDQEVHRAQLRALREMCELPNVTIQILRLNRTSHAGLAGPFTLLETPEHQHLAYAESQRGSLWISDPDEVSILARKYAMLRTQALTPEESMGLLDSLLGEQ